jgi:hypothetical protein
MERKKKEQVPTDPLYSQLHELYRAKPEETICGGQVETLEQWKTFIGGCFHDEWSEANALDEGISAPDHWNNHWTVSIFVPTWWTQISSWHKNRRQGFLFNVFDNSANYAKSRPPRSRGVAAFADSLPLLPSRVVAFHA